MRTCLCECVCFRLTAALNITWWPQNTHTFICHAYTHGPRLPQDPRTWVRKWSVSPQSFSANQNSRNTGQSDLKVSKPPQTDEWETVCVCVSQLNVLFLLCMCVFVFTEENYSSMCQASLDSHKHCVSEYLCIAITEILSVGFKFLILKENAWENELTDSLSEMLKCPISRFRRENEHECVSFGHKLDRRSR